MFMWTYNFERNVLQFIFKDFFSSTKFSDMKKSHCPIMHFYVGMDAIEI